MTKRPDARPRAQDRPLRRGDIIGKRIGGEPESEAHPYMKCLTCDGYFDMRDLAQAFGHDGSMPHTVHDNPQ